MGLTTNFGFKTLGPGDTMSDDNYQFSLADRELLDSLLQSVLDHHHDGQGSEDVVQPAAPTVTLGGEAGVLDAGYTYEYKVAWVDEYGRESMASDPTAFTTPESLSTPAKPSATFVASGGTLSSGTHAYVVSAYDGDTYTETRASLAVAITLPRGNTHAVDLVIPETPDEDAPTGWNIYRRRPGGLDFFHIGSTTTTEFTDDGLADDCNRYAPDEDTLGTENSLIIEVADLPEGYTWKVYRSSAPGYWEENSLVHHVVEHTSEDPEAPVTTTYIDVGETGLPGTPNDYGSYSFFNPTKVLLTDGAEVQGLLPASMIDGVVGGGGGGPKPPQLVIDTQAILEEDAEVMLFADPTNIEAVYRTVPLDLGAELGTRWYLQNGSDSGFGIHPDDGVTIDSILGYKGVAKWGEAILWNRGPNEYVLTGDLVEVDPYSPPEPELFMFRMMADTFDRADAPVLGTPDDGIPVAYEYEGDGDWEVSDNSAVFTGGTAGPQTVFCDTGGFGSFKFITGAGDVGTTSELRVIVGSVWDTATLAAEYMVLNEAGEFIEAAGGVENPVPVHTLTGFPGFVVGEEVSLTWDVSPGNIYNGLWVRVGETFEEFIETFPGSSPGFGDYIGFTVDFVTAELPKSIQFWEVEQTSSSLVVPKAFAGTRVDYIGGGDATGPPVDTTSYNGDWEWLEGSPWTSVGSSGFNAHYNAINVTEGDDKYARLQFDVASANQFVAGGFRALASRRGTDAIAEIVRHDGFLLRGSATECLAILFSDDTGTTPPRLYHLTDDGATETLLHEFSAPILDALNIDTGDGGWCTVRAFIGADDIFWLQVNGVTESIDLSALTLPAGTDVGVLHRETTDGAVPTDDRGIGWWTFDGYALV